MGSMGHDNESLFVEIWRDGKLVRIARAEYERMRREVAERFAHGAVARKGEAEVSK